MRSPLRRTLWIPLRSLVQRRGRASLSRRAWHRQRPRKLAKTPAKRVVAAGAKQGVTKAGQHIKLPKSKTHAGAVPLHLASRGMATWQTVKERRSTGDGDGKKEAAPPI